ncbi:MAG: hypothetical protein MJ147_07115 [Clostridia bacterium]|nr:hypothetical protein [Clostridia bacterium]
MRSIKKIIALLMAVIMLAFSCSVASYAKDNEKQIPSIIVPGIFQSEVFYYENGEKVCDEDGDPLSPPFFMDSTDKIVKQVVPKLIFPLLRLLITQKDKNEMAATALADALCSVLMTKQLSDNNGKFINDVRATKYNDSFADLSKHDQQYILDNLPLERYIEKGGADTLYVFSYASLGNMIDTANELYEFIQFVKKDSGSDKVNIVPISQGGSIANALLQVYADKGISLAEDINRVVYVVPALDGSILVGEIYENGLIDDDNELYRDMIPSLMGEDDWTAYLVNILLRILPNAELNNILDKVADTLAGEYLVNSTLIWGLVPSGNYPAAREKYLSTPERAEIAKQTDWFYNAQKNRFNNILKAIDDGVEVFDIVDYNYTLYELVDSWDDVNADGIIQLSSESMGCYSAGVDVKLPADYVSPANNCKDPKNHDHSDPNGIVDAYCGLLPETTFFFYGQDHEKTGNNNVIMYLVAELLTNPEFKDVHSYPDRFPQFNVARESKHLMRDVAKMKAYNTSAFTAEQKKEFNSAIEKAESAIENTALSAEEFELAKTNFYETTSRIINGDPVPEKQSFDFEALLTKIMKLASDVMFMLFKGKGFSELCK